MNWSSRKQKGVVRGYQLAPNTPRGALQLPVIPRTCAIFLPGWDEEANTGCLCIERALELGTINLSTRIIAVERVRKLAPPIANRLAEFGFHIPPYFHQGELHDLVLTHPVDYANFDFLGTLDTKLADWLETCFSPTLLPNATISFTFTRSFRNNHFMIELNHEWRTRPELRQRAISFAQEHGIHDDEILIHLVILRSCFYNFSMRQQAVHLYQDSRRTMIACRFDSLIRCKSDWPTNTDIRRD